MIEQPSGKTNMTLRKDITLRKASLAHWTPADIRAEIVRLGSTPSRIAIESGFSANAGRACLRSPCYPGAEIAIAQFLGLCPAEIWPERYASGSLAARSPARQRALETRTAGRAA